MPRGCHRPCQLRVDPWAVRKAGEEIMVLGLPVVNLTVKQGTASPIRLW